MKGRSLALILVLIAGASACTRTSSPRANLADADWSELAPPDCRCSVEFPGVPSPAPSRIEALASPIPIKAYGVVVGDVVFTLSWSDMPASLDRDAAEAMVRGYAAHLGAQQLHERAADISGFPGMQADWQLAGRTTEMRAMVVGRRAYQLIVDGADRAFDREASARFLESFRLVDPGADNQVPKGLDSFEVVPAAKPSQP